MDAVAIAKALEAGGPWALVALLLFALWQKDKQHQTLLLRIVRMVETNTSTNTKVEGALSGLRELLAELIRKADKGG